MADTHGHEPDSHDDHDAHAPEEDAVRTPAWLTFVGVGLLLTGALASYLWVYPGTMSASSNDGDAGVEAGVNGDASADGAAVAAAPAP